MIIKDLFEKVLIDKQTVENRSHPIYPDGTFLRSSDKQKLNKLSNIVNDVNRYFEDGTRFGTYRMMIDKGYSRDKASLAARN